MAGSVVKNYFPSQVVSDLEKMSIEYGMKVAKAIEYEWFEDRFSHSNRYLNNRVEFHKFIPFIIRFIFSYNLFTRL